MARFRRSPTWACVASVLEFACGGDGGTPPGPTLTVEKAPTSGDNQVGDAGQPLLTPFAVLVKENGSPKAGVNIAWTVTVGGGSVSPGTSATGSDGIASTVLTAGSDSVVQRVTAANATLVGSPLTFNATGRIQGATQIALAPANSGNGQTDTVLSALANSYRVILLDEADAPVAGVDVVWSVPGGQGSVSPATSTSDPSGIAAASRTLGSTAGSQTATASVRGLIGSPVVFTATGTAGDAFQVDTNSGTGTHFIIDGNFPYTVIAKDRYGNPKSGVVVRWAVQTGTGSVNPTEDTTGTDGIATTTRTLGASPGSYADTAYAPGLPDSIAVFTIVAVTAPSTAGVDVGDIFFRSARNGTQNLAVDTIAVGGRVTWTWVGAAEHNVQSEGSPSFTSSPLKTGVGQSYQFPFNIAGTYNYDCIVHGSSMRGQIVVLP